MGFYLACAYQTDSKLDKINVKGALTMPDDYGQIQTQSIYSFKFTRSLYAKVNWLKLDADRLVKIAPDFTFSPWMQSQMEEEMTDLREMGIPAAK